MPKETFFNLNEEKQEKVMRAAISEFISHGYEKGNVGNIAKNAGVAKGSMYQYFEDKRELFLFTVKWSTDFLVKKYYKYMRFDTKDVNFFDYLQETSKETWLQMRDERDLVIFIQDVFLGKYRSVDDSSMEYIMKAAEKHILGMIQDGQRNGYIRKDIDGNILSLYVSGVSMKIKEHLMNRAREAGEDIVDEEYEKFEDEIKALIELLRNGMGAK